MSQEIFSVTANTLAGEEMSLGKYKGKVLIIVNTASKCGFTKQYAGLENLYRKYSDKGLEILGFPCNQFGNQEPGDAREIEENCLVNYGVSFQMFEKVDVNGNNAHPLFKLLKKQRSGLFGSRIKWNFTKFVIDRNGNTVKRFAPATAPEKMENYIRKLL
ncbi:MAG: glutathione peroxidase [Bacteroidales bacterium]